MERKLGRTFSIKRRMVLILLGTLVPAVIFLVFYNFYVVNAVNYNLAQANAAALSLYCSDIEDAAARVSDYMVEIVGNDSDFRSLAWQDKDKVNVHVNAYNLSQKYASVMNMENYIAAFLVLSEPNAIYRGMYRQDIRGYESKSGMINHFKEKLGNGEKIISKDWQLCWINDEAFIYSCLGYGGAYCVCLMDLDSFSVPQNDQKAVSEAAPAAAPGTAVVAFFKDGQPVSEQALFEENHIKLGGNKPWYFSGSPARYMILEQEVGGTDIGAAYMVLYKGYLKGLNNSQYLLFVGSMLMLFLIPISYMLLKKTFFKPVDRMVAEMGTIQNRADELSRGEVFVPDSAYPEIEFQKVNAAFNHMLEVIQRLKIEAYENELDMQNVRLQYYQIQIRPHFFLNCLKNIYGMAEEHNYENIQRIILYLSRHLRYMLREDAEIVTVEDELQYVRNYILLQQISMKYPPECRITVSDELLRLKIPAISILSFVENSVKYYGVEGQRLEVDIHISRLPSSGGQMLRIAVQDNGQGFTKEELVEYNFWEEKRGSEHIGIYNVIQRFILYYGKENVGFIFSNHGGAAVEILIQFPGKEGDEDESDRH